MISFSRYLYERSDEYRQLDEYSDEIIREFLRGNTRERYDPKYTSLKGILMNVKAHMGSNQNRYGSPTANWKKARNPKPTKEDERISIEVLGKKAYSKLKENVEDRAFDEYHKALRKYVPNEKHRDILRDKCDNYAKISGDGMILSMQRKRPWALWYAKRIDRSKAIIENYEDVVADAYSKAFDEHIPDKRKRNFLRKKADDYHRVCKDGAMLSLKKKTKWALDYTKKIDRNKAVIF